MAADLLRRTYAATAVTSEATLAVDVADTDLFGAVKRQALIDTQYREVIDRILLLHDLQLGVVHITQGGSQAISEYSDLVEETEGPSACQTALASSDTALALNVVFVESIRSVEDPGSGIAGFSPQYGTVSDDDEANNACCFVSQAGYDLSTGLTQEESDGVQGGNVLHEAGHFIGLPHTLLACRTPARGTARNSMSSAIPLSAPWMTLMD